MCYICKRVAFSVNVGSLYGGTIVLFLTEYINPAILPSQGNDTLASETLA